LGARGWFFFSFFPANDISAQALLRMWVAFLKYLLLLLLVLLFLFVFLSHGLSLVFWGAGLELG
jgi:hypothetical protein